MTKVNKNKAERLYGEGYEIHILPCKMRLDNMWVSPYIISNKGDQNFGCKVREFEAYNCNVETGKYPHFYIK